MERRAQILISIFTGGDPAIEASMAKRYSENPVDEIHPGFDPAIFAYVQKALASLG
jgi:hypothetical protein